MFIGRKNELELLNNLKEKNSSSLVCVLGRRRIGKSTMIEEFGKSFKHFFNIQGLSPHPQMTKEDQLKHFSIRMANYFKKERVYFENWSEAFLKLASYAQKKEILILLDEISWMGHDDHTFSSALKEAWDVSFKKNQHLILVVCGSVSSWIEDNILKSASFEGRISLEINLRELSLPEINQFWQKHHFVANSFEKMLILSITGGVPKYLEEIVQTKTFEKNILSLCFQKEGMLFNEFDKIFIEIFGRKSKSFEQILRACLESHLEPNMLAKKLHVDQNKEFTTNLRHLELAGFITRDYYYKPDGTISKFSHFRIKDNYTRFYLKHIFPLKDKVQNSGKIYKTLSEIKGIDSLYGLQFENLILANRHLLNSHLNLEDREILSSSPYRQYKTLANKGGCQIDLLIAASFNSFYLCELKCKKWIEKSIIQEVEKKSKIISLPKKSTIRPVLVYEGEIYPPHFDELKNYFYRIISFEQLLMHA